MTVYKPPRPKHQGIRIMEEWPATAADERLLAENDEGMATGAPIGDRVGNWLLGAVLAIEIGIVIGILWSLYAA